MKFQATGDGLSGSNEQLLAKVFEGVDLTENEVSVLQWLAGWERFTIENLCSAIEKKCNSNSTEDVTRGAFAPFYQHATQKLNEAWQNYLDRYRDILERESYYEELDMKYFATAEKKGRTAQQIEDRRREKESREADMKKYRQELKHYLEVDKKIKAGTITPTFISTTTSSGSIPIEATYIMPMPDQHLGFFDTKLMIVRKLR